MFTVPRWDRLISTFKMAHLPLEGGYYKAVYRSDECIPQEHLSVQFSGERSFQTSIYFLLIKKQVSKIHRLKSDEVWHFYEGSSLTIHEFTPNGEYRTHVLGADVSNGESFQVVVPRSSWFGACLNDTTTHALVGCTMTPGFDFQDFEIGNREELVKLFPSHKRIIEQLT
ncbi:uncharacterized protein YML079W-like [Gigantopelta aegis]|uniref:uncharacterized protein YML079W-like n=1 Tax=Gigantopelta aegis TaxID=1735272 RepID=UPI001B888151|nr:uncharacterized protein YML079W-like [Gigantopelta aegis]XP_041349731.1 uncharacterized protein YML079W-like [Gigantopelta aegis]XP_041349732.1 uncharacterized protein YML079W-like [Gigantopelta aegis]XP_041349734.1 uncharacterized protein YML079W-like [Gigantopelta aegis]